MMNWILKTLARGRKVKVANTSKFGRVSILDMELLKPTSTVEGVLLTPITRGFQEGETKSS